MASVFVYETQHPEIQKMDWQFFIKVSECIHLTNIIKQFYHLWHRHLISSTTQHFVEKAVRKKNKSKQGQG